MVLTNKDYLAASGNPALRLDVSSSSDATASSDIHNPTPQPTPSTLSMHGVEGVQQAQGKTHLGVP